MHNATLRGCVHLSSFQLQLRSLIMLARLQEWAKIVGVNAGLYYIQDKIHEGLNSEEENRARICIFYTYNAYTCDTRERMMQRIFIISVGCIVLS